jgi:broad specificity phosphatase PhoE
MRRRIYLMRHAEVAYFEPDGRPVRPEAVSLTSEGEKQARAARDALVGVRFDRCVTSGLPRTVETARIVAPDVEPEAWPDLRELEAGRLGDIPEEEVEQAFTAVFRHVVPEGTRFLGGETIGSLFDRVLPALERLLAEESWDVLLAVLHGGVNRAILSYGLTGERTFLGNFEQAPACVNILDTSADHWVVRAVNVTPYDLAHLSGRQTTMEQLYSEYLPYRKGGSGAGIVPAPPE